MHSKFDVLCCYWKCNFQHYLACSLISQPVNEISTHDFSIFSGASPENVFTFLFLASSSQGDSTLDVCDVKSASLTLNTGGGQQSKQEGSPSDCLCVKGGNKKQLVAV